MSDLNERSPDLQRIIGLEALQSKNHEFLEEFVGMREFGNAKIPEDLAKEVEAMFCFLPFNFCHR